MMLCPSLLSKALNNPPTSETRPGGIYRTVRLNPSEDLNPKPATETHRDLLRTAPLHRGGVPGSSPKLCHEARAPCRILGEQVDGF